MPTPSIRIRKDSLRKDGTAAIYLQLVIERKKLWIPLELHVEPDLFDESREKIRSRHPLASDWNLIIDQALARCTEILIRFRLSGEQLTADDFRQAWDRPKAMDCFLSFWEREMYRQYQAGQLAEATLISHKRMLGKLQGYCRLQGWQELPFFRISLKLMAEYDLFLARNLRSGGHDGRTERWNSQKAVKKYLNVAREAGKEFQWPFPKGGNVKLPATQRTCLSQDELRALLELWRSDNPLITQTRRIVLRGFLVQCFTGLRFSDLVALPNQKLGDYIGLIPQKTKTTGGSFIKLPVSKPVRNLLAPCSDILEDRQLCTKSGQDRLVPTMSDQATNRELKTLAKMARVPKYLTTHVGRHTFATIFLERGGTVEVLQKLLGHRSIKTTMVYVHLTDQRGRDQIVAAFDGWDQ